MAITVAAENGMERKKRRSIRGSARRGSHRRSPTREAIVTAKAARITPEVQPPTRRLDDAVGEAGQQGDDQHLPDTVDAARFGGAGLGDVAEGQDSGDQADGDVDPEDGPPPDRADQQAPDDRAQRHAEPDDGAPDPDRLRPLLGVGERVGDDRHGHRVEHRTADGLDHAEHHQRSEVGGQAAEEGSAHEGHEADHEGLAPAQAVRRGSREHQQAGQDQGVGVDGPLQAGDRGVQVFPDGGEGDVDDGHVEAHDQEAHGADEEDADAPAAAQLVDRRRGRRSYL